jgi:hypothetical protein
MAYHRYRGKINMMTLFAMRWWDKKLSNHKVFNEHTL